MLLWIGAALGAEDLLLGGGEFLVGEGTRLVQGGETLQFAGCIVGARCRRRRSRGRRLGVGRLILIGLLLGTRFLPAA